MAEDKTNIYIAITGKTNCEPAEMEKNKKFLREFTAAANASKQKLYYATTPTQGTGNVVLTAFAEGLQNANVPMPLNKSDKGVTLGIDYKALGTEEEYEKGLAHIISRIAVYRGTYSDEYYKDNIVGVKGSSYLKGSVDMPKSMVRVFPASYGDPNYKKLKNLYTEIATSFAVPGKDGKIYIGPADISRLGMLFGMDGNSIPDMLIFNDMPELNKDGTLNDEILVRGDMDGMLVRAAGYLGIPCFNLQNKADKEKLMEMAENGTLPMRGERNSKMVFDGHEIPETLPLAQIVHDVLVDGKKMVSYSQIKDSQLVGLIEGEGELREEVLREDFKANIQGMEGDLPQEITYAENEFEHKSVTIQQNYNGKLQQFNLRNVPQLSLTDANGKFYEDSKNRYRVNAKKAAEAVRENNEAAEAAKTAGVGKIVEVSEYGNLSMKLGAIDEKSNVTLKSLAYPSLKYERAVEIFTNDFDLDKYGAKDKVMAALESCKGNEDKYGNIQIGFINKAVKEALAETGADGKKHYTCPIFLPNTSSVYDYLYGKVFEDLNAKTNGQVRETLTAVNGFTDVTGNSFNSKAESMLKAVHIGTEGKSFEQFRAEMITKYWAEQKFWGDRHRFEAERKSGKIASDEELHKKYDESKAYLKGVVEKCGLDPETIPCLATRSNGQKKEEGPREVTSLSGISFSRGPRSASGISIRRGGTPAPAPAVETAETAAAPEVEEQAVEAPKTEAVKVARPKSNKDIVNSRLKGGANSNFSKSSDSPADGR